MVCFFPSLFWNPCAQYTPESCGSIPFPRPFNWTFCSAGYDWRYSASNSFRGAEGRRNAVNPMFRVVLLFFSMSLGWPSIAHCQVPLGPIESGKVDRLLDALPVHDTLKCNIQQWKPFLDFTFRFDAGYFVRCPLKEFQGQEFKLAA